MLSEEKYTSFEGDNCGYDQANRKVITLLSCHRFSLERTGFSYLKRKVKLRSPIMHTVFKTITSFKHSMPS